MITTQHLRQIRSLVSMTKETFNNTYVPFLNAFNDHLQDQERIDIAIHRAVRALKIRRAYMLPVGTDAETCYREQEVWTYGVFVYAMFWDYIISNEACEANQAFIAHVIPDMAKHWMERHAKLLALFDVNEESKNVNKPHILRDIVVRANPELKRDLTQTALPEPVEAEKPEEVAAPKPMQAVNLSASWVEDFISWLGREIRQGELVPNLQNGIVHRVKAGWWLQMPAILEAYKNKEDEAELGLQSLMANVFIDDLSNANHLLKNEESKSHMHGFYYGAWANQSTLWGLIIKSESLPELNEFPVNGNLKAAFSIL